VAPKIKDIKYEDVANGFSDYYKNMSSFGIDLLSPDFDMRVYSFGKETGYQHPPFSPFPTYTLSEKWSKPAKQYVIAEEYVRNPETNERIFLSCALMSIESMDLKGVTAERYLYDGALSSVLFTSSDQNYKVWYSSNDSHDHQGRNFVTWRRMFVYPKSTVNQYFDRYTVAAAFPSRTTNNLGDIKWLRSKDHTPATRDLLIAPELKGYDTVFPLNSYYQAIENTYPKFGARLSLRGILKYDTLKELLATRGVAGFEAIWQSVLDPRELTKYALLKQKGELKKDNGNGIIDPGEISPFFEEQLAKIKSMTVEQNAEHLLKTIPERNPIVEPTEATNSTSQTLYQQYKLVIIGGALVIVGLLIGLLFWLRKKRAVVEDIVA
jgi:hypothetical protein